MPSGASRNSGGQPHEFWSFNLVKMSIIWTVQLVFMWLILRNDMKQVLRKEPDEDWDNVNLVIKIMTITNIVLIALDVFFWFLQPHGLFRLRWHPAYYFWSCVLKNIVVLVPIVTLVVVQIRSRRNDQGQGWLLMDSCLLEGYFLAPTVYAWMVWSTEAWSKKYERLRQEDW